MLKRFLYLAGCVILLLFLPIAFVSQVRDFAVRLVKPVGQFLVHENAGLANFVTSLSQISTLREEKKNLQAQVVSLQQQLADKEEVTRENQSLRQELDVTGTTRSYAKVFAHVVIQGSDPFDHTVTIDAGAQQGLTVGQPAVYQGALVGKVISVRANSAVIRLITSKQSVIQVWLTDSREKGLLVGDGNGVSLTDITQGVAVKDQSIIETSGLGGSLPQGILVGQTGTARSKQSDLSQSFSVSLPQNLGSLESLFILLTDMQ